MSAFWTRNGAAAFALGSLLLTALLAVALVLIAISLTSPESQPLDPLLLAGFAISTAIVGAFALKTLRSLWYFQRLHRVLKHALSSQYAETFATDDHVYDISRTPRSKNYVIEVRQGDGYPSVLATIVVTASSVLVESLYYSSTNDDVPVLMEAIAADLSRQP